MSLEFSPVILPAEDGSGIEREFTAAGYGVEGSLHAGFDPIVIDHGNEYFGLDIHIFQGDVPEPVVRLVSKDRDRFIRGIESDEMAAQFVVTALQQIIELKQRAQNETPVEIDAASKRLADELVEIDRLEDGEADSISFDLVEDGVKIPSVVPRVGAENYRSRILSMLNAQYMTVIESRNRAK